MTNNEVLHLRSLLVEAIRSHRRGLLRLDALYEAADRYRDGIRQYAKAKGRRMKIPTRAYLIRALG